MAQILRNHYVLAVHNNERSAKFFQDLGFEITMQPPGWIFLCKDNCQVMLGECADALHPSQLGDHNYFGYLMVDDANGYYQELKDKGITTLSPIADKSWGMREFSVVSPEGHRLMIGQWLAA